jgi:hypothetical protein
VRAEALQGSSAESARPDMDESPGALLATG